jgi:hypothetical protein
MYSDSKFFIDNLWRWKCNIPELDYKSTNEVKNMDDLYKSQWCDKFDELRRNRMVLGTYRYGDYKKEKIAKYNRIESAISRLKKYQATGNSEFLLDVANLCMIEFDVPNHKNAHFESIDDGEHVNKI